MKWRLLPDLLAPMPYQMALDEILLSDHYANVQSNSVQAAPMLRFFQSAGPWVTVGYTHREPITNPELICRRITGGGRVQHGEDLIFSLIASKRDDETFDSVRVSYWKIHEAVKSGFKKLGTDPRFYRVDENLPKGTDCFMFPIATDLALGNQKVAGGSQKRTRGIFLHQESVKIPKGFRFDVFKNALIEGFSEVFKIEFLNFDFTPQQLDQARELSRAKYENMNHVTQGYAVLNQG